MAYLRVGKVAGFMDESEQPLSSMRGFCHTGFKVEKCSFFVSDSAPGKRIFAKSGE
jgi:hypothetical protein